MPKSMRIKKHKNGNQYLMTGGGIWVRNFIASNKPYIDINKDDNYREFMPNEYENIDLKIERLDNYKFNHPNCIIVSNGFDFKNKQKLLSKFPNNEVAVIGINGALRDWDLTHKRTMNYYVVNNPFPECMRFLPTEHSYTPRCIASTRTYPDFLKRYQGQKLIYAPTPPEGYIGPSNKMPYKIDDSRNPICAAIVLAHRFKAKNILLFCCDDSFERNRPGSIQLDNGLWTYPHQKKAQELIDGYLHWIKNDEISNTRVMDFSMGFKYKEAEYINHQQLDDIFNEQGVR